VVQRKGEWYSPDDAVGAGNAPVSEVKDVSGFMNTGWGDDDLSTVAPDETAPVVAIIDIPAIEADVLIADYFDAF